MIIKRHVIFFIIITVVIIVIVINVYQLGSYTCLHTYEHMTILGKNCVGRDVCTFTWYGSSTAI